MLVHAISVLVLSGGILAALAQDTLLATLNGTVRGITSKMLTMEDEDGNTLQFDSNRKTRYFDGKKQIAAGDIKEGDRVSVEARRLLDGRLEAVNVRRETAKKPSPQP